MDKDGITVVDVLPKESLIKETVILLVGPYELTFRRNEKGNLNLASAFDLNGARGFNGWVERYFYVAGVRRARAIFSYYDSQARLAPQASPPVQRELDFAPM